MSALVTALPVTPVSVTPPVAADAAPTADSATDFGVALSTALGGGQEGLAQGDPDPGADQSTADVSALVDPLAAGGNVLPPVLPPELVVVPEQIVAVVLEAQGARAEVTPAANAPAIVAAADVGANTPELPALPVRAGASLGEAVVMRTLQPLSTPESVPVAPRITTPARDELPTAPTLIMPVQPELVANAGDGADQFKQAVMENLSRLGSVADTTNDKAVATPAPVALAMTPVSTPLANPAPAASFSVPVSFGQAGWGQAMSQQVVWAVNQNLPSAELHLSPPDLGPVSVRISVDADQGASISFAAAHGAVREAIEAALPRLRDMLSTQGIALADVNVSSHENFHQAQRESAPGQHASGSGEGGRDEAVAETRSVTRTLRLLDTYA